MIEQWQELKETITELRDNDGTGTQQEVCKFLVNYMGVLEKQMQGPCDDAISRQAVCNIVNDIRDCISVEGYCAIIERLKKLPLVTQKSGKWIPVSERLLEDGKWAIFTDGKNISVERFKLDAISHFFPNGRWFELEDAIAWMPLPEPYEPQESEVRNDNNQNV